MPPEAEQHRIVAKVDELMALCDRLDEEQTDAESAHARLVDTLLATLTQSADATELAANWQRLAGTLRLPLHHRNQPRRAQANRPATRRDGQAGAARFRR